VASIFEDVRNKPMRHPPVTSSATWEPLPALRRAARQYIISSLDLEAAVLVNELGWSKAAGYRTREHQPRGGTPRELARSGSGALTPDRRPSSRRASTKEQGRYWHDTYIPPWSQGCSARPPTAAAGVWYKHLDGRWGVLSRARGAVWGSQVSNLKSDQFHLLRTQRTTQPSWKCPFDGI
jgi:hypothetical protein